MAGTTHTPEAMLERLVAFDTTSAKSNLALIEFVRDYLAGHGVASRLVHDETGAKANLVATLGPQRAGGVALCGHTDVVPVTGQSWDTEPFALARRGAAGERLYGRGTADMKSFIAVVLALVPEVLAARPRTPLHVVLSYDEEVGCFGMRRLLDHLGDALPRPEIAIIGEPTQMCVVTAHKGVAVFETEVSGVAAHSSAPDAGVNAVAYAAEIIAFIFRLGEELRAAAAPESGFDPPWTTVNVAPVTGGTAINIIPAACRFLWEFRTLPNVDAAALQARVDAFVAAEILPRMAAAPGAAGQAGVGVTSRALCTVPGLRPEPGSAAETLVTRLTGANRTHTVAFAAEAGMLQRSEISTVICGPGDIAQAHQPNEWIARAQIDACVAFMRRLIEWAAG